MNAPYIHEATRRRLEPLRENLPHGVLLSGPEGVGLSTIAEWLTSASKAQVSFVLPERNEVVDLEKGTITVDSIRRLYEVTKTKEPKGRIIIIPYAERMATTAQNAFLKLLEEPNEATHFILLSHAPQQLLPTIMSRVQSVEVRPVTLVDSNALLDTLRVTDATKRAQLLFIAEGLPGALTRFAMDQDLFTARATIVKDARTYLSGEPYEKLLLAKKYKDDRASALTLVEDAMKQLKGALAKDGSEAALRKLGELEELYERILANGNIRLQLGAQAV